MPAVELLDGESIIYRFQGIDDPQAMRERVARAQEAARGDAPGL